MITLLDYGAGNVRSVINAVERLGETIRPAVSGRDIASAEKLIFPGVGAFGSMMRMLRKKNFIAPLKDYLASGRPFFGICLGMHALFDQSEEAAGEKGLGLIPGTVRRFDTNLAVPHIGWNGVSAQKKSRLFNGFSGDEKFYFVHSFHVVPKDRSVTLATTNYGVEFVSAVQTGSIFATQFHPEKSGEKGLALLKNFLSPGTEASRPVAAPAETKLAKRVIACLDVRANDQGDLVVTKGDQYDVREKGRVRNLGKPVEAAEKYYRQGADEITFLNITGFRDFPLKDLPMLEVLKETSKRVCVPLAIGGGIRDYTDSKGRAYSALEVADRYFRSGADKISIGSDAVLIAEQYLKTGRKTGRTSIERISDVYGSQAVVVSIDPKRAWVNSPDETRHPVMEEKEPGENGAGRFFWHQATISGGREPRDMDAVTLARICEELGAGEILLNSIDRDGTGAGFDMDLIRSVKSAVSIPVIASSGAGSPAHFVEVFTRTQAEAALAAGIFHRGEVSIGEVKRALDGKVETRA